MTAYFIVRAEVPADKRDAFDKWYENEHLLDAHKQFGTLSAKRGWSTIDPTIHMAFYEFSDLAAAEAATSPDAIAPLIAEFDKNFPGISRSRQVIDMAQTI